jgi:putative membrane protein
MKRNVTLYLLTLVTACWTACDDDDNNENENALRDADRNFVQKTAMANMIEVDFATIAVSRAHDSTVKVFANHMITEHNQAQTELREIADDFDNVDWPTSMDAQHQQIRQQLMTMAGHSFDSMYMTSQVNDHEMTLTVFENELDSGKNDRVKNYANKYMPHIEEHLEMADSIKNNLMQPEPEGQ